MNDLLPFARCQTPGDAATLGVMPNFIKLRLTAGEERHLDAPDTLSTGIVDERLNRGDVVSGEWIKTLENTLVHRSQVVEAIFVANADDPERLSDYT